MAADDHAIVVGIAHYPQLTTLKGPVRDAEAFHDWLTDPAEGGVPPAQAKLIVSKRARDANPLTARPMFSEIQAEFDALQQAGLDNDLHAGRRLWLYFAGHGVAPNTQDSALLMANAQADRLYHLPAGPYLAWFRAAAFFDEVIILMDCCRDHNGRLPGFAFPWPDMAAAGADVHYFTGFATKWSRKARERRVDDAVRGLFTLALLEGLRQGTPTAKGLKTFVTQRLPELTGPDAYQDPVFDFDRDDLMLSATAPVKPCTLTVVFEHDDPAVTVTVLDGTFAAVQAFAMQGGSHDIPLDPGIFAVRRSDRPDADQLLVPVTKGSERVSI